MAAEVGVTEILSSMANDIQSVRELEEIQAQINATAKSVQANINLAAAFSNNIEKNTKYLTLAEQFSDELEKLNLELIRTVANRKSKSEIQQNSSTPKAATITTIHPNNTTPTDAIATAGTPHLSTNVSSDSDDDIEGKNDSSSDNVSSSDSDN